MKFRSFRSKGGLIQLVWMVCFLLLIFHSYIHIKVSVKAETYGIGVFIGLILFPLSGLLGDVVLGRYKAIKWSLYVLWASVIIYSLAHLLFCTYYDVKDSYLWSIVSNFFLIFWSVECGLFMTNSLNFGIDQLVNPPSWQISSYISWYCWIYFLTDVIRTLVIPCSYYPWNAVNFVLIPLIFTVAVCLDLVYSKDLVKEPTSPNPFRLIYKVLLYAAKNKYPRLRSAFSYWDEKKSRLDLSKMKYGGPFKSEEVENVKTFFRMLGIILLLSFFVSYFLDFASSKYYMFFHFQDDNYLNDVIDITSYRHCMIRNILQHASSFLVVLGVPIFECFLYPMLWKYDSSLTILNKFIVGMCFLLISQLNYLALEVAGTVQAYKNNVTFPCLFRASSQYLANGNTFTISFFWLGIPEISSAVAYYLLFTSGLEFLCAQFPYSMKGFLMGLSFSAICFFVLPNVGLKFAYYHVNWRYISCGMLYLIVSATLTAVLIVSVCAISKWYSKRRHGDNFEETFTGNCDLPNRASFNPSHN